MRRPCGYSEHEECQNAYQYPDDVINVVRNQERLCIQKKQLSFTSIVIRLRENIREQLQIDRRYVDLPEQISEIYYFHLHREHSPNRANEHYCTKK